MDTADSAMGCYYNPDVMRSPCLSPYKRRIDEWAAVEVSRGCSTVKSKRRRLTTQAHSPDDHLGDLGVLPAELVDVILHKCGSRTLGALNCVSRHFRDSYITERRQGALRSASPG